jgi:hypothetical protein
MEQIEDMHLAIAHALCISLRARIASEGLLPVGEA